METRELISDIVETQLRDGNPPATRETLARLMATGMPRIEAVRLIAQVMAKEVSEMIENGRDIDQKLYTERLNALPKLP